MTFEFRPPKSKKQNLPDSGFLKHGGMFDLTLFNETVSTTVVIWSRMKLESG